MSAAPRPTLLRHVAAVAQRRCCYCCCCCCYWRQLSQRSHQVRNISQIMHAIEGTLSVTASTSLPIEPCFHFTAGQVANCGKQPRLGDLVANKTRIGEFFYGIEITSNTRGIITCVDFNQFLPVLPTFISLAWLAPYWQVEPIGQVQTLQLTRALESYIPAMPHLSTYRLSEQHYDDFFDLNFDNLLAVRGDELHEDQAYKYTRQMVAHARRARGKEMTIAVAGHPEGHANDLELGPQDIDKDLTYLKEKIDCGSDFIITQICYTPEPLIEFLRKVHRVGIEAPVMVGVVVPNSFKSYLQMERVSKIRMPKEMRAEAEKYKNDDAKAQSYFVQHALSLIQRVLDADLGMHGIQFYTMNNFEPVFEVLGELRRRGILKESSPNAASGAA
ncbi:methylenetetrahydrofolate reductase [Drosophila grimshawi]|uniref:GH16646 n=1 Tax=Drosophila grimshawi TaxID=7222 RepID=B4J2M1_DROGR|nr:methylenetetrahydrofolate reductase [Drosophila grimshawi]EDV97106.1 GH16646 [Drosophila grimshawi]